ncbi:hypothetical protein OE909_05205 [Treponema denticola]|nr:hypothetical protein OE909_05205 [Treponema denticola]
MNHHNRPWVNYVIKNVYCAFLRRFLCLLKLGLMKKSVCRYVLKLREMIFLKFCNQVPNRAWKPSGYFWIIPADRNSCDILLNNLYNEGICRADSGFDFKNSELNNTESLNTEISGERNNHTATDIQSILNKLEEVLTAKHYSKRTMEAYSYWISRFIQKS